MRYLILVLCLIVFNRDSNVVVPNLVVNQKDLECMTKNLYYEARGESDEGMRAVGRVVLNRYKAKAYPKSICGVIYQNRAFSWTLDKRKVKRPVPAGVPRERARFLAWATLLELDGGSHAGAEFSATHFHEIKIKPKWSKNMVVVATIGNHTFYKA